MPSRSTTGVLVSIKVLQLVGSLVCMVLHIVLYFLEPDITPHITVFCGTFMGFTLVNLSFLISAAMGKPAAEELDMALGVLGGILFYTCGILSMFFVKRENKKDKEVGQLYFDLSRAQAMASLLTALIFVFDACLKFDMWNYERNKRKKNRLHEEEPPVLRLFCVDMGTFCYRKCRCCKCCDSCCEKFCKCCRPQEEEPDVESNASGRSSISHKSAPMITVEKYKEKRDAKEGVVVQRVEIGWLGRPERYSTAIGEGPKKDGAEEIEQDEGKVSPTPSMTAASFLRSQTMTWPMPLQSMVPPELSVTPKRKQTKPLLPVASTSTCPIASLREFAIPTVSFQRDEGGHTSTIIQAIPSTALSLPVPSILQIQEEDTSTDAPKDILIEIVANIPPEENIPRVEAMSPEESPPHDDATHIDLPTEESSMAARSRTPKEQ